MLVFSFLSEDSGQCRVMWEPAWLTDRQRWWISMLMACHSFLGCHKSLPSPLKVRLRCLLADLQAPPARHMSFYQPWPRWHCGGRVLTPPLMREREEREGEGRKKEREGGVCVGSMEKKGKSGRVEQVQLFSRKYSWKECSFNFWIFYSEKKWST